MQSYVSVILHFHTKINKKTINNYESYLSNYYSLKIRVSLLGLRGSKKAKQSKAKL